MSLTSVSPSPLPFPSLGPPLTTRPLSLVSPGEQEPPLKDSANLARIRDNQRRSRARRREYVQDLEARLRRVELQGVEAAAEIQLAARRVAQENRRLRALLNRRGMGDDAIEGLLAGGEVDGMGGGEAAAGRAVQRLEQLLVPRRPSCGSLGVQGQAGSRETLVVSDSGRNNGWEGMAGNSPRGLSPLAGGSRQLGGLLPSPSATSGMQHTGIYTLQEQESGDNSSYSIDYDTTIPVPYVQLSSPQEYSSIPVDYFGRARGFSQEQYPC